MIELPSPNSISAVSDWIELVVSIRRDIVSRPFVASSIEGTYGEEPSEPFLATIWRELASRQRQYIRPNFSVEDRTVEAQLDIQPTPEYIACLLLSVYGLQDNAHIPAKLFERISREAVERYLSGKAKVFGWPFDEIVSPADSEESQIMRKIKELASDMGERFVEAPAARYKDRGIDVVGWIPFTDKRSGQVVILLQCAAGQNWKDKNPVPVEAWCEYIHWSCNPSKAYAVPCVVDERDWHDESKIKGIIFDRIRIINLLSEGIRELKLRNDIDSWVHAQLLEMDI